MRDNVQTIEAWEVLASNWWNVEYPPRALQDLNVQWPFRVCDSEGVRRR